MRRDEVLWIFRRTISNTIAASILLFALGPFGSQSELQREADDTATSVLNRLYYEPKNQDKIAVVLLDDDARQDLQEKWPLPRRYWAEAAQILACAGAKAIFFDILFDREESPPGPLYQMDQQLWEEKRDEEREKFCNIKKRAHGSGRHPSVPIYFAFTNQPGDWLPNINEDHKLLIEWEPIGSSYPLAQFKKNTLYKTASYELSAYGQHPEEMEEVTHPPSSQNAELRAQPPERVEKKNLPLSDEYVEKRVTPLWTQKVDTGQPKWKGLGICPKHRTLDNGLDLPDFSSSVLQNWELTRWITDTLHMRDILIWSRGVMETLHIKAPYLMPAQCPPFLTINLSQLINPDSTFLEQLGKSTAGVRDRIVLVGQSFSGNYDYVPAPMHQPQQLPGVYLHATVLENLLTMKMKFDQIGKYDRIWVLLLVVTFSFLEALLTVPPRPWLSFSNRKRWIPASLCVLFATIIYFRCRLHWPLGMVPGAALHFTFDLLLVKIIHHHMIYEWVDRLFGIDPHHEK